MSFVYWSPESTCNDYQCISCAHSMGKHKGCVDKEKLKKFIGMWVDGLYEQVV